MSLKSTSQVALAGELLRLILYKDELCRLPARCHQLCVISGLAWLSINGQDIVLKDGQSLSLPGDHQGGLVSAVGPKPLILEVSSPRPESTN